MASWSSSPNSLALVCCCRRTTAWLQLLPGQRMRRIATFIRVPIVNGYCVKVSVLIVANCFRCDVIHDAESEASD